MPAPSRRRVEWSTVVLVVVFWLVAVGCLAGSGYLLVEHSFELTRNLNDASGGRYYVPLYLPTTLLVVVAVFLVSCGFQGLAAMRERVDEADRGVHAVVRRRRLDRLNVRHRPNRRNRG